jgi:hypothetical protein|tara:strand:+ start:30995 stop:31183 length:189 start_codon:yes stop_codon:yes gene_type:complete
MFGREHEDGWFEVLLMDVLTLVIKSPWHGQRWVTWQLLTSRFEDSTQVLFQSNDRFEWVVKV